jgi:hypothetical protein
MRTSEFYSISFSVIPNFIKFVDNDILVYVSLYVKKVFNIKLLLCLSDLSLRINVLSFNPLCGNIKMGTLWID